MQSEQAPFLKLSSMLTSNFPERRMKNKGAPASTLLTRPGRVVTTVVSRVIFVSTTLRSWQAPGMDSWNSRGGIPESA
jgi:hypothetical protein